MPRVTVLYGLLLAAGCQFLGVDSAPGWPRAAQVESAFDFALVGDNPYNQANLVKYRRLIDDVNAADLAWVVHLGDLKGSQSCAGPELRFRFELNQGFRHPFVLTPGDNDWYDCVRPEMGGFDDFERLAALRRIFYPEPGRSTGGRTLRVRSQGEGQAHPQAVENVLWQRNGVVFATAHVIGPTRPPTDGAAFAELSAAWQDWIGEAFDVAERRNARGVFLAMQADPWPFSGLPELFASLCGECARARPGLEPLYPLLVERSRAFGRPVVVAVGDTHVFRVDKPLYDSAGLLVENLTRVEPFGHPYVHWVRVTVDPDDPQVFRFRQELVPGNLGNVDTTSGG